MVDRRNSRSLEAVTARREPISEAELKATLISPRDIPGFSATIKRDRLSNRLRSRDFHRVSRSARWIISFLRVLGVAENWRFSLVGKYRRWKGGSWKIELRVMKRKKEKKERSRILLVLFYLCHGGYWIIILMNSLPKYRNTPCGNCSFVYGQTIFTFLYTKII